MKPRKKREQKLTGAQLLWLTGDAGGLPVEKWENFRLQSATNVSNFDYLDEVLDKIAGHADPALIEAKRAEIQAMREDYYRRYPGAA